MYLQTIKSVDDKTLEMLYYVNYTESLVWKV